MPKDQKDEPQDSHWPKSPSVDKTIDSNGTEIDSTITDFRRRFSAFDGNASEIDGSFTESDFFRRMSDVKLVGRLVSQSRMPDSIGEYKVLELIGNGGMGQVYKVKHGMLGKLQSLKVLRPSDWASETAIQRFRKEIQIIGGLDHPNIVAARHAEEIDGQLILVMDFIEGESLEEVVSRYASQSQSIPVELVCDWSRQAAIGLQYLHDCGVVHRDVKPANLILDKKGIIRVIDLGLASLLEPKHSHPIHLACDNITLDFQILGTPDFMAPEQLINSRNVDFQADIYALGATLYYLLTGKVAFADQGLLFQKALSIINDAIPDLTAVRKDVPNEIVTLVEQCLSKSPKDRPISALAVAQILQRHIRINRGPSDEHEYANSLENTRNEGEKPKTVARLGRDINRVWLAFTSILAIALGLVVISQWTWQLKPFPASEKVQGSLSVADSEKQSEPKDATELLKLKQGNVQSKVSEVPLVNREQVQLPGETARNPEQVALGSVVDVAEVNPQEKLQAEFLHDREEIENLLAPFLAVSESQPTIGRPDEPNTWLFPAAPLAPISYGRLQASGALADSQDGLHRLYYIGGFKVNFRPKRGFPEYSRENLSHEVVVEKVKRARELLLKYGPIMVKKGMLEK
jgi:serine/threonine protein kinase